MLISCFIISAGVVCKAQPTLTHHNTPSENDIIYFGFQDTTNITAGNSGANIIWDFSTLVDLNKHHEIVISDPVNTEFYNNYLESNHYQADSSDYTYSYFQINEDSMNLYGSVNQFTEIKWAYNNPEKLLKFPFNYQESFQDTFYGLQTHADFAHSGEPAYRNGNVTVTYDGYGSLHLPGGNNYDNVIRIKTVETYHDSICSYCSINVYRIDDVITTTYSWYIDTMTFPILKIQESDILINYSIQNHDKNIWLFDIEKEHYTPLENNIVQELSFYPNPTNGQFYIENIAPSEIESVSVHDILGKVVPVIVQSDSNKLHLDLSSISKGVHIIKLSFQNGYTLSQRVIKE